MAEEIPQMKRHEHDTARYKEELDVPATRKERKEDEKNKKDFN